MEVLIPNMESSPYLISPSTPKRFGEFYFSAPTSPRLISEFYQDFDDFSVSSSVSTIPFDWEEKPGTPKSPNSKTDFTFDFSEVSEKTTLPAEELFDGGKIRPLKPPPFSPRKKKEFDIEKTEQNRGRERVSNSLPTSRSGRRGTRSQSPYRVSKYPWEDKEVVVEEEEEEEEEEKKLKQSTKQSCPVISKPTLSSTFSSLFSSSPKSSRKWKLKDFFLFRSASEGRAADKDPLKKYCALFKKNEDVKNTSFRSVEGSKRRGVVSAHELHYTANRAVSEDLKKKTFLPYKQGILGRLAFNPAVHALANGFGFSQK